VMVLTIQLRLLRLTYPNTCSCLLSYQERILPLLVNSFSEITLILWSSQNFSLSLDKSGKTRVNLYSTIVLYKLTEENPPQMKLF
jgi:hypothetical protein